MQLDLPCDRFLRLMGHLAINMGRLDTVNHAVKFAASATYLYERTLSPFSKPHPVKVEDTPSDKSWLQAQQSLNKLKIRGT
jgi:hypothetical protein